MFSSESFALEDCLVYTDCTSDEDKFFFGGGSHSYSSDGLRLYGAYSEQQILCKTEVTARPIEYSFKFVKNGANHSSSQPKINIRGTSTLSNTEITAYNSLYGGYNNGQYYIGSSDTETYVTGTLSNNDVLKLKFDGTTASYYRNESLITTRTISYLGNLKYFGWYLNNGRDWYIKDFKIKPL